MSTLSLTTKSPVSWRNWPESAKKKLRDELILELQRRGCENAAIVVDADKLRFVEFINLVKPKYKWYRHCKVLAAVLQKVADGVIIRLMVFMPPRHGKSELVSRLFSAYYLYLYPERWVGINSYAADLAYTLSRSSRENFKEAGGLCKTDADAVKHWETRTGGGLWASGVGGPITGKGFHFGDIDDPIKNAEEASSEIIRAKHIEWYESTFYTREEPGGSIVLIQTRWNPGDLGGYLLEKESEEEPECWHIVCFEAIKTEQPPDFPATCTVEPDWRQAGEPLCPERYPIEKLRKIKARIGDYFWSALFQQRPVPRSGGMFKREWFRKTPLLPKTRREGDNDVPITYRYVRYWDKAGTEGGGARTAGVLMAASDDRRFFVLSVIKGQWSAGTRESIIAQTAHDDRRDYGRVETWIEQEGGSGGKESAEATLRNLSGFIAHKESVHGDKPTRAEPFATQLEAGSVYLIEAPWNASYIEEHTGFPRGSFKDQVDASSGAFNKLEGKTAIKVVKW